MQTDWKRCQASDDLYPRSKIFLCNVATIVGFEVTKVLGCLKFILRGPAPHITIESQGVISIVIEDIYSNSYEASVNSCNSGLELRLAWRLRHSSLETGNVLVKREVGSPDIVFADSKFRGDWHLAALSPELLRYP